MIVEVIREEKRKEVVEMGIKIFFVLFKIKICVKSGKCM